MNDVLEKHRVEYEVGVMIQESGHTIDRMERAFLETYAEAKRLETELGLLLKATKLHLSTMDKLAYVGSDPKVETLYTLRWDNWFKADLAIRLLVSDLEKAVKTEGNL